MVALRPAGPAKPKPPAFRYRDTDSVRHAVNQLLKQTLGTRFEQVIEERGYIDHKEGEQNHRLELNIKTPTVCGSLVSAWYSNAGSVESQLLRAEANLNAAARIYKPKRIGLFVCRPFDHAGLTPEAAAEIDKVVEETIWRLKKDRDATVDVEESDEALAASIATFAKN